jgi:uncharacterized membrane protein (DUF4010 family)
VGALVLQIDMTLNQLEYWLSLDGLYAFDVAKEAANENSSALKLGSL